MDRAIDNLVKSGKLYMRGSRRDHVPTMMGGERHFADHGKPICEHASDDRVDLSLLEPRMHGGMSQRHSIGDYESSRSHSASNLQNFYAAQRYQGRANEAEQMMQAKRRMAAQRERELRNYHQEQQYNRSSSFSTPV